MQREQQKQQQQEQQEQKEQQQQQHRLYQQHVYYVYTCADLTRFGSEIGFADEKTNIGPRISSSTWRGRIRCEYDPTDLYYTTLYNIILYYIIYYYTVLGRGSAAAPGGVNDAH